MRLGAVHAKLTVPPVSLLVKLFLSNHLVKLVETFLSCTSSDELADAWHKHVESLHGLAVIVGTHVEGFECLREVIDANRALEDLLSEVTFVLTAHVDAPVRLFVELFHFLLAQVLFQDLNRLRVSETHHGRIQEVVKAVLECGVDPLVEEIDVVSVVLHHVTQTVLNIILSTVHDVGQFSKSQLGLNHPELSQMTRSVALLSTECRSKRVHVAHAARICFNIDLSTHSQESRLLKEVFSVVDPTLFERDQGLFFDLFLFFSTCLRLGITRCSLAFSNSLTLLFRLFGKLLSVGFGDLRLSSFLLVFLILSLTLNQLHFANGLLRLGQHCRDLKHFSSTFTVTRCDDWRVDVLETAFLVEFVCSISKVVADSHHRRNELGATAQVGLSSQELLSKSLGRQRVLSRVGRTCNGD